MATRYRSGLYEVHRVTTRRKCRGGVGSSLQHGRSCKLLGGVIASFINLVHQAQSEMSLRSILGGSCVTKKKSLLPPTKPGVNGVGKRTTKPKPHPACHRTRRLGRLHLRPSRRQRRPAHPHPRPRPVPARPPACHGPRAAGPWSTPSRCAPAPAGAMTAGQVDARRVRRRAARADARVAGV